MRKQGLPGLSGLPDSQNSNWTFLDRMYQQNSVAEHEAWRVGPNKIIHEESSEMSFSSSTPDPIKLSNDPVFGFKDQIITPRLLPKVKSSINTKITPPSSSSRTPPRSSRSSIKYSRQFEEIIRGQLQQKPEIEQEEDFSEKMSEISFFGANNVNDIRRRAHNYHQPVKKRPVDVDSSLKIQDSNILKLSREVLKELKKDKQEEKLAAQLKWLKKQNINKMFENIVIRKESDKKIKETVDKLRIIKKQDIAFHEKVTKELQELDYMSKEIMVGFENLQQKASLDFKEQQLKKLQNLIIQSCPNCREGDDDKAIRRMESNPYAPDVEEDDDGVIYSKQSRFRRRQLKSLVQQNQARGRSQDITSSSDISDLNNHTHGSLSCSRIRKTTETPQAAASSSNFFVKVLKSPVLSDRVILKFTSGSSSFEVEVRINETVEIGFHKKQENSFQTAASPASNSIKEERHKMKRLFQSGRPEEIENQTEKNQSGKLIKLQRIPTRDFSSICEDCAARIEGAKTTLQYFAEEDEKAIAIEANYMEGLLKKLSFAPSNLEKSALFSDRVESMNFLKEVGTTSEALFASCFDAVPLHATRIEKLFKSLVLFFEIKIRNYIHSQRALLLEVEESKLFMHKKKYAFDQINKLQSENRKLLEDLKFLERFQKETKQKYKKQVKLLMQKIEELRGYQITRKESSSSDDDSNSQNSSQRSRLHYKDNLTTGLYEPPEQLLKILPEGINN